MRAARARMRVIFAETRHPIRSWTHLKLQSASKMLPRTPSRKKSRMRKRISEKRGTTAVSAWKPARTRRRLGSPPPSSHPCSYPIEPSPGSFAWTCRDSGWTVRATAHAAGDRGSGWRSMCPLLTSCRRYSPARNRRLFSGWRPRRRTEP